MARSVRPPVCLGRTRSLTSSDVHEVRTDGESLWCTCKGWAFSRTAPKRCRHTDQLLDAIASAGGLLAAYRTMAEAPEVSELPVAALRAAPCGARCGAELFGGLFRCKEHGREVEDAVRSRSAPTGVVPASDRAWSEGGRRQIVLRD